jgi:GH15 family glucan-1,4-alpha-glucosidase
MTAIVRHHGGMPLDLEDYAFVGDRHTAALIGKNGSVDWLCFPRFDSGACFSALLGGPEHGHWWLAPEQPSTVRRRYIDGTLVLESDFTTDSGSVRIIDFMPPRSRAPDLVRIVVGLEGRVRMRTNCVVRFDYGSVVPWITRTQHMMYAVAGPDSIQLRSAVELDAVDASVSATFDVQAGQRRAFVLTWHASHEEAPPEHDPEELLRHTLVQWREWSARCTYEGPWRDAVVRSLITLKGLTYEPTGGIVAAATTSLPEQWQGPRNWDYRYCWLRDATFTLYALLTAGYDSEARAWRDWLLRAVAGDQAQLQIMYGIAGERRLSELELDWLPGYRGARPVRIGNAAYQQRQLDIFGEVMDVLHTAERVGLLPTNDVWSLQRSLVHRVEEVWREPDEGIWEVRGEPQQFTHSKVMAWVAVDRALKTMHAHALPGPHERWSALRETIHQEVCAAAYNQELGLFTQYYGSRALDASLLTMPLVGFLPATDPRMQRTIEAIRNRLTVDGFVLRYAADAADDGLPPGEGTFLLCTFWLADNLILLGRSDEARVIYERLLSLRNDVGLLSEQYDPRKKRLLGNFPQAFSHVAMINTAYNLTNACGPAEQRGRA